MFLIRNATVADGSGSALFRADVALDADGFDNCGAYRICGVFRDGESRAPSFGDKAIDFGGDLLFPAFIDMHCHSEFLYMRNRGTKLRQEDLIQTEVAGTCGISCFPVSRDADKAALLKRQVLSILGDWPCGEDGKPLEWHSFSDFRRVFESCRPCNDIRFLQGHAALRIAAMDGNPNRRADFREVGKMCALLDDALSSGALGLSTGLYYAPCIFADRGEMLSLLRVVAKHNGIFAIHRREEGNKGYEATVEAIQLARETGVRLEISHLKAVGGKNQSQVDGILRTIDAAKAEGIDVTYDQYPYLYGSTSLSSLLPPSVLALGDEEYRKKLGDKGFRLKAAGEIMAADGFESIIELVGFDEIYIQSSDTFPQYANRSISDIASSEKKDPFDVFFDVLQNEKGAVTMKDTVQTEENLLKLMSHPLSLFGTDALYAGSVWHERSTEAARHMLSEYSGKIALQSLVARSTSKPAARLRLDCDFVIREGAVLPLARFSASLCKAFSH